MQIIDNYRVVSALLRKALVPKILTAWALLFQVIAAIPSVSLVPGRGVQFESGVPLAAVGRTFVCDVVVNDGGEDSPELTLPAGARITSTSSQSQHIVINGKHRHENTYSYKILFSVEGECDLGPARIASGGKSYTSDPLHVRVIAPALYDARHKRSASNPFDPKITCEVEKKTLVTGESTFCTLTLIIPQSSSAPSIAPLTVRGCTVELERQNEPEMVRVSGRPMVKFSLIYRLRAHTPGSYVIGPVDCEVGIPVPQSDPFGGGFFSSFSPLFAERETVTLTAPEVALTVVSLPPIDEHVTAIGHLDKAVLTISEKSGVVGQPLKALLTLSGDPDALAAAELPELVVPEGLLVYRAGVSRERDMVTGEYIIQGTERGLFEIPAQKIISFESEVGTYTTLITAPVKLSIGGAAPLKSVQNTPATEAVSEQKEQSSEIDSELAGPQSNTDRVLSEISDSLGGESGAVSWLLIGLLLLCALLFFFGAQVREGVEFVLIRMKLRRRFEGAARELDDLVKREAIEAFAPFFAQCEVHVWKCSLQELYTRIGRAFGDERVREFDSFRQRLDAAAYGGDRLDKRERKALCSESRFWFELLTSDRRIWKGSNR